MLKRQTGGGSIERFSALAYSFGVQMNASSQFLQPYLGGWVPLLYASSYWWTAIGFAGNIMFSSRFLFQWLASEKERRVIVPAHFWYLSFWGSVLNLLYALHIDNAPILFGVIALPFIYGRNIYLLHSAPPASSAPKTGMARPRLGPA